MPYSTDIIKPLVDQLEKFVTIQAGHTDLMVRAAQHRHAAAVRHPPVVPGIYVKHTDRRPAPAQGHQCFQHAFAKVTAWPTVDEQLEHGLMADGRRPYVVPTGR